MKIWIKELELSKVWKFSKITKSLQKFLLETFAYEKKKYGKKGENGKFSQAFLNVSKISFTYAIIFHLDAIKAIYLFID